VAGKLAIALDCDDLVEALKLARQVSGIFSIAKVGLELYCASGPEAVEALIEEGFDVFVDLKLHDIPNTVRKAARVIGGLGARFATVHCQGGREMVEAAIEGFNQGGGSEPPVVLGVTVLTSDPDHSSDLFDRRLAVAIQAGCGGIVCSADDLATLKNSMISDPGLRDRLLTVVPGIRTTGDDPGDQIRIATPGRALQGGAGILVIGRSVSESKDPKSAAQAVARECLGVT